MLGKKCIWITQPEIDDKSGHFITLMKISSKSKFLAGQSCLLKVYRAGKRKSIPVIDLVYSLWYHLINLWSLYIFYLLTHVWLIVDLGSCLLVLPPSLA